VDIEDGEHGQPRALLLSEVCGHFHDEDPVVAIRDGDGGDGAPKVQTHVAEWQAVFGIIIAIGVAVLPTYRRHNL
jgi:hypothetical protein